MDTRDRIIESSFVLFLKNGWDNVSLNDVKKASNITSGGFYHHFNSKEELISVIEEKFIMSYFDDVILRIYQIEGNFKEKIGKIMYTILSFDDMFLKKKDSADEYYKRFYALYVESVHRNNGEDHILTKFHKDLLSYNENIIKEAKLNNEISKDIDESSLALFLLVYFKGIIALWLVIKENITLKEFVDKNIENILGFVNF